jgi:hypothetical protein
MCDRLTCAAVESGGQELRVILSGPALRSLRSPCAAHAVTASSKGRQRQLERLLKHRAIDGGYSENPQDRQHDSPGVGVTGAGNGLSSPRERPATLRRRVSQCRPRPPRLPLAQGRLPVEQNIQNHIGIEEDSLINALHRFLAVRSFLAVADVRGRRLGEGGETDLNYLRYRDASQ